MRAFDDEVALAVAPFYLVPLGRGSRFWRTPLLGTPITLRQGARVIEDSRRLRVVSSQ